MHRYYLTYQFILKFERELRISASKKISRSEFQSLSVSCEQLIQQFSLAIREKDETRASKYYFVALVNLKDCQEAIIKSPELWIELRPIYQMLEKRLEKIVEVHCEAEGGQLRMLG